MPTYRPNRRMMGRPRRRAAQYITDAPTHDPRRSGEHDPQKRKLPLGVREIGGRWNNHFARDGHQGAFQRHQPGNQPIAPLAQGR